MCYNDTLWQAVLQRTNKGEMQLPRMTSNATQSEKVVFSSMHHVNMTYLGLPCGIRIEGFEWHPQVQSAKMMSAPRIMFFNHYKSPLMGCCDVHSCDLNTKHNRDMILYLQPILAFGFFSSRNRAAMWENKIVPPPMHSLHSNIPKLTFPNLLLSRIVLWHKLKWLLVACL